MSFKTEYIQYGSDINFTQVVMVASGEIDNPLLNAVHILLDGPSSPKDVVSMKEKMKYSP
ncbi:hypothetical protein ACH36K_12165 [Clostridium sp. MB05]|uniref:hypothetical protein n=1 Tax=Clostridium sp. MB05 TaxID=3376682 RepID=UPI003982B0CF